MSTSTPPTPQPAPSEPFSERYEDFLKLIERDNPALHRKITGHD